MTRRTLGAKHALQRLHAYTPYTPPAAAGVGAPYDHPASAGSYLDQRDSQQRPSGAKGPNGDRGLVAKAGRMNTGRKARSPVSGAVRAGAEGGRALSFGDSSNGNKKGMRHRARIEHTASSMRHRACGIEHAASSMRRRERGTEHTIQRPEQLKRHKTNTGRTAQSPVSRAVRAGAKGARSRCRRQLERKQEEYAASSTHRALRHRAHGIGNAAPSTLSSVRSSSSGTRQTLRAPSTPSESGLARAGTRQNHRAPSTVSKRLEQFEQERKGRALPSVGGSSNGNEKSTRRRARGIENAALSTPPASGAARAGTKASRGEIRSGFAPNGRASGAAVASPRTRAGSSPYMPS